MHRIAFTFLLVACATESAAPVPSAAPVRPEAPSQAAMQAILVRRCGECHQSGRPTAVPEALAVFDLDRADWPQRFDSRRFRVALERLGREPWSDRDAFIAFHAHARR